MPTDEMNVSSVFKHNNFLSEISPNAQFLACAHSNSLTIRDAKTLHVVQNFTCADNIIALQWSPDSELVACSLSKKRIMQVWYLLQPDWNCKIDQGMFHIIDVCWSPDSRHLLLTSEFHLRITIWSLCDKAVYYMKYAKPIQPGKAFSRNGKFLALAERRDCQDHVSIFACATWQLVKHFKTKTSDMAGIMWAPDDSVLCVWETPIEYRFDIYSLDGQCLETCNTYPHSLGITVLSWSSTSQILAVGSFDQKVRLFNHITWKSIVDYNHPLKITDKNTAVYKETEVISVHARSQSQLHIQNTYSVEESRPYVLAASPPHDPKKGAAGLKNGIEMLEFSADCQFIASVSGLLPSVLWVWSLKKLEMSAILIQKEPIRGFEWHPDEPRLVLCTGSPMVYMWSPEGAFIGAFPQSSSCAVQKVRWSPDGCSLLALDEDQACLCFLT